MWVISIANRATQDIEKPIVTLVGIDSDRRGEKWFVKDNTYAIIFFSCSEFYLSLTRMIEYLIID